MKLPIPTLLYLSALGMFGWSGWSVYRMLPQLKQDAPTAATSKGQKTGADRLGKGKGQGPVSVDWQYTERTAGWWAEFKSPNLIGKLPEKPPDPTEVQPTEVTQVGSLRPLEEIIELVSLVSDNSVAGRGGDTHVVVRYKPEANVVPPDWYLRENQPVGSGAAPAAMPADTVAHRGRGGQGPKPAPLPVSTVGKQVLQQLWVVGTSERRASTLWGEFSNIKLVRVAPDAQSAFFVRVPPPPKAGEPAVEAKEEELIKTTAALSQDLLRELRALQGHASDPTAPVTAQKPIDGEWIESDETKQVGNRWHIGRKDETRFQDPDQALELVSFDTYVSKHSDTRGLIVRGVDTKLAASYGIATQDVLLEVNNRPVQTRAQVVNFVKGEYNKGVRTYYTKWLSNGQVVERVYQAPTK